MLLLDKCVMDKLALQILCVLPRLAYQENANLVIHLLKESTVEVMHVMVMMIVYLPLATTLNALIAMLIQAHYVMVLLALLMETVQLKPV
jgi:hypothetical protein